MKLFNSLSRQKEEFTTIEPGKVKMYACGPTVYNFFHIGNARCFIIFDFLRRYLEYRGYDVTFVQNFTDIDDKMIKKANEEGVTVKDIAERYIAEYFTDAKGLGIRPASVHPKATENIDRIIDIVATLEKGGYAYAVKPNDEAEGMDVYYSTRAFKGYGQLSHQSVDDLMQGASERTYIDDIKKDPLDFALWKAAKPGEPSWDSPWGKGRPGWHIECSAMVKNFLGDNIDIHCGGQDLTFPHHENEIAQSEAYDECCGCKDTQFAKFWLHNAYINVDGEKMAKSAGNFFTVRDAAKIYGYDSIRYFIISAHYRSPVNFSEDTLKQAKAALERLNTCEENLKFRLGAAQGGAMTDDEKALLEKLTSHKTDMIEALDDDFNTANGVAAIFELCSDINLALRDNNLSKEFLANANALYTELLTLFGFEKKVEEAGDEAEIEAMIAERTAAKKAKNYAEADRIRDELKAKGIILEDTPQGVKWKRA